MFNKTIYISAVILTAIIGVSFSSGYAQDSVQIVKDSVSHPTYRVDSLQAKENKKLQRFKKVFKKIVKQQKARQKKRVDKDPALDLGVMILNKTRSRMGQEFYRLFFQNWKAPKNVGNFTLTIFEKPFPGLSSVISITINHEKVYSVRLQPKHSYIKAVSKQAIAYCRRVIKRKTKMRERLAGY